MQLQKFSQDLILWESYCQVSLPPKISRLEQEIILRRWVVRFLLIFHLIIDFSSLLCADASLSFDAFILWNKWLKRAKQYFLFVQYFSRIDAYDVSVCETTNFCLAVQTLFNYQALQMFSRSLVNFRSSFECKFSSLPNNSTECSKSKCQSWHEDKVPTTPLDSGLKLNQ